MTPSWIVTSFDWEVGSTTSPLNFLPSNSCTHCGAVLAGAAPVAAFCAEAIVEHRKTVGPFETTGPLADLIAAQARGPRKKIHPATRTFQALRIAVNDELGQIERLMPLLPRLLKPGGRVGVISFHSLEDRLVKRYFKDQFMSGLEAELMPSTKKPIAGATEDVHNPRSRSAKLRVAVKK